MKFIIRNWTLFCSLVISLSIGFIAPISPSFSEPFSPQIEELIASARAQIGKTLLYDPDYVRIDYPMGDVPILRGVCTDVVIRAFRGVGVDLQEAVHKDMKEHFSQYPQLWGLRKPDPNIDHRRVPNLETYFRRSGKSLKITQDPKNFHAGDIVSWILDNGRPHIGIVSDRYIPDGSRPLIIHNIGWGTREDDILLEYKIAGHFRYF